MVRILRVTLLLIQRILDSPIPPAAEENLPEDSGAPEAAEYIGQHVSEHQCFEIESFNYFKLMMRLRERPSDRMRFISRLALTPGPGEWRVLELPKPLFPLYKLVRVTRLLSRAARGRI